MKLPKWQGVLWLRNLLVLWVEYLGSAFLPAGEGTLFGLLSNRSVEIDCGLAMALAKDIALGLQASK